MALWSVEQLQRVRAIVGRYHAAIAVAVFGPKALPPDLVKDLRGAGIPVPEGPQLIDDAFAYGQLVALLRDPALATKSPTEIADLVVKRKLDLQLSPAERASIDVAKQHAGQYAVGLGTRVAGQVMAAVTGAEANLTPERMVEVIADKTAGNRARRETIDSLRSDLGHAMGNWTRDWQRIAMTESNNAIQEGTASSIEEEHGADVLCSKMPRPDACHDCKRLYLRDGQPIIFKLSELRANGTNVGRRKADWKPTIEAIHPWCGCMFVRVPEGMVWKDGELVVAKRAPPDDEGTEQHGDADIVRGVHASIVQKSGRSLLPMPRNQPRHEDLSACFRADAHAHDKPAGVRQGLILARVSVSASGDAVPVCIDLERDFPAGVGKVYLPTSYGKRREKIDPVLTEAFQKSVLMAGKRAPLFRARDVGVPPFRSLGEGTHLVALPVKARLDGAHADFEFRRDFRRAQPALVKALDLVGGYWQPLHVSIVAESIFGLKLQKAARRLHGRAVFHGLPISIENAAGSSRRWFDPVAREHGSTTMIHDYGYIRLTEATDGDHVDCYVGPDKHAARVYVVHQQKKRPDGSFGGYDEDKCFLGFPSASAAKAAYLAHYNDPRFFGSMTTMTIPQFKGKLVEKRGQKLTKARRPFTPGALVIDMTLEKAGGPFIGPRGGKWADPEHTIPWSDDVPTEALVSQAGGAKRGRHDVSLAAHRAVAAGADPKTMKYVGSGMEGAVFEDASGKAFKVSHRVGGEHMRNEAEALEALKDSPVAGYVAKHHGYNAKHDVVVRDKVEGSPGGWAQEGGLQEIHAKISDELRKRGFTAPEFKGDSYIMGEDGAPKLVDVGFVNPIGARLAKRLAEKFGDPAKLKAADPMDLAFDVSNAYGQDHVLDYKTAEKYMQAITEAHPGDLIAKQRLDDLDYTRRQLGDDPRVGDKVRIRGKGMHPFFAHVIAADGDTVTVGQTKEEDDPSPKYGVTMPAESFRHFVGDLNGRVSVPQGADPDVNLVASNRAEFLGKGDDGAAFRTGDNVVKASTTVPYQPFNPGHLTPEAAADRLEKQTETSNAMLAAGVPGILPTRLVRQGDKAFQIKPYVEIPEKLTREQLDSVADSVLKAHAAGWVFGDEIQVGIHEDRLVHFDTGKAHRFEPATKQPSHWGDEKSDDISALKRLYANHGEKYLTDAEKVDPSNDWDDAAFVGKDAIDKMNVDELKAHASKVLRAGTRMRTFLKDHPDVDSLYREHLVEDERKVMGQIREAREKLKAPLAKSFGAMRPDHKYISRRPKPGGGWEYEYPAPAHTQLGLDFTPPPAAVEQRHDAEAEHREAVLHAVTSHEMNAAEYKKLHASDYGPLEAFVKDPMGGAFLADADKPKIHDGVQKSVGDGAPPSRVAMMSWRGNEDSPRPERPANIVGIADEMGLTVKGKKKRRKERAAAKAAGRASRMAPAERFEAVKRMEQRADIAPQAPDALKEAQVAARDGLDAKRERITEQIQRLADSKPVMDPVRIARARGEA